MTHALFNEGYNVTKEIEVPTHLELMWPTLTAIKALGGSGSNEEIFDKTVEQEKFSEHVQKQMHTKGNMTKLEYRSAWARTYLKMSGAIENSARGVWSITKLGETVAEPDLKKLVKRDQAQKPKTVVEKIFKSETDRDHTSVSQSEVMDWRESLLSHLRSLDPADFEKLCQRLLRESGFVKVRVTGKSGDGGIDGVGVLRVNLLSFHVLFQCKRYQGSVASSEVRDFRGAMVGRSDKGLMITTGTFTSEARKEATRDGAPAIDLIDGNELCVLLKELKLGIAIETVEVVTIDSDWFAAL
jgi:restriction system protein